MNDSCGAISCCDQPLIMLFVVFLAMQSRQCVQELTYSKTSQYSGHVGEREN